MMLTCTNCGRTMPETEFYKDRRSKSGYKSWCRTCQNADKRRARADSRSVKRLKAPARKWVQPFEAWKPSARVCTKKYCGGCLYYDMTSMVCHLFIWTGRHRAEYCPAGEPCRARITRREAARRGKQ